MRGGFFVEGIFTGKRKNVSRETNEHNLKIFAQFIQAAKIQGFHVFFLHYPVGNEKMIFEKMFHVKQTNIT